MSGQQALTLVGQAIGGYFFGPIGAGIGGAIGSVVGGLLFSKDVVTEGPRLSDLHIQTSTYGLAVPIVHGSVRIAGNVIWASAMRETVTENSEGGKGGDTATLREYSYDMDVAIALCEGEILDIERIFANGILIFDKRAGAVPAAVFASGLWATGTFLYVGSETQLPDPTIEAAVGVGNCSAYRGTAYLMITGLQLNVLKTSVLPSFEFVIMTAGSTQTGEQLVQRSDLLPIYDNVADTSAARPIVTSLASTIRVANFADRLVRVYDLSGASLGTVSRTTEEDALPAFSESGSQPWGVWVTFDYKETIAEPGFLPGYGDTAVFTVDGISMLNALPVESPPPVALYSVVACVDKRHYLLLTGSSNIADAWYLVEWDGSGPVLIDQGPVDSAGVGTASSTWNVAPVMQGAGTYYMGILESDLRHAWQVISENVYVWEIDAAGVLRRTISFTSGSLPLRSMTAAGSSLSSAIYAENGLAAIVNGAQDNSASFLFLYTRVGQLTPTPVPIETIITNICERAGIPAIELSFPNLSDNVEGFVIGQSMTARSAIDSLRPAFFFDGVDGDVLKFVKRGAISAGTFEYADLGAGADKAQNTVVTTDIMQETELPSRFNVRYISKEADYQIGAQSSRRETTESQEIVDAEVPCVLTDAYAAQVADVNMRDHWAGSYSRKFFTGIKYTKFEPTDVIAIDDGLVLRTVRITQRIDRAGLIEWEARDEDVEIYDSNAVGMSISVPVQTLAIPGSTNVEVLDLPPLTETQVGGSAENYVAARGFQAGWTGALVELSRDSGGTYTAATAMTTASTMGAATTVLANFTGGNVFDEMSSVTVDVGSLSTLSSTTRDLTLAGANAAVLGDEIIQFRTATLISTGVYTLTGLLRGRKGTERAMATHAVGDRFILLSTLALQNLPLSVADSGSNTLRVRATTSGSFSGAVTEAFITSIARLRPYSPVHLSATRDASADWLLTWVRRDRYMNDWNSGVDVPMSEASELYDVEVMSGSTILATYTDVSTRYQTVASTVLGYSPTPTSISFRVYQKSAIVGRGFVAEKTVTQA